jgi:hypothetical protein
MKKIGIIGTRRRDTPMIRKLIENVFWEVYEEGDIIVSGGCPKGGDKFAEQIAKSEGIPILTIYPNYKRYKRAAPIIRNSSIAQHSDIIIACVMYPGEGIEAILERKKGGTEDTLRKFCESKEHNINNVYLV